MKTRIIPALAIVALIAVACSRSVSLETSAPAPAEVSLRVTNDLTQAVNIYVVSGSSDMLVKQVAAKTTETMPVRGIAAGSTVQLKATTVDGTKTYTRNGVVLRDTFEWRVTP
jgi:hypothetical protein